MRAAAVFAHNEARTIRQCLNSLQGFDGPIYVLVNGCTDSTEDVVRALAERETRIEVVQIPVGDKANAWNVFVHEVAPSADVYVFVDGDISVEPGAIDELERTLDAHPSANGASAIPAGGRSAEYLRELAITHRLLMGNLYALRGVFVANLRRRGVRMPVGYIGEDGLITSLAKWNGDPNGTWDDQRVVASRARFRYRSLSPWSPRDCRLYFRRRVRYSLRALQDAMLVRHLKRHQGAIPTSVSRLYREFVDAPLPWSSGVNVIFEALARQLIRDAQPALPQPDLYTSLLPADDSEREARRSRSSSAA